MSEPLGFQTKHLTQTNFAILQTCFAHLATWSQPSNLTWSENLKPNSQFIPRHEIYNTRKKAAYRPLFPRPCRQPFGLRPSLYIFYLSDGPPNGQEGHSSGQKGLPFCYLGLIHFFSYLKKRMTNGKCCTVTNLQSESVTNRITDEWTH